MNATTVVNGTPRARRPAERSLIPGIVVVVGFAVVWSCMPIGMWGTPFVLWLAQFFWFARFDLRREIVVTRLLASLQLGFAVAWAAMPSCLLAVRPGPVAPWPGPYAWLLDVFPEGRHQRLVLAGFPIPGIGGHGGGGWRIGYHSTVDLLVHAANVALLTAAIWWGLGRCGVRARLVAYWLGFAVLLPATCYGLAAMLRYWD